MFNSQGYDYQPFLDRGQAVGQGTGGLPVRSRDHFLERPDRQVPTSSRR